MIITRTPFRVSFFGGGSDYPNWFLKHGGGVLATTINKYCYISLRKLPPFFDHRYRIVYSRIENTNSLGEIQHPSVRETIAYERISDGLEIHHDGDLPARSGLGSSSAFTVGLLNALRAYRGHYVDKHALAQEAIHIEQVRIGEAVGCQDQILAAFGGLVHVEFHRGNEGFEVTPLVCSPIRKRELNDNLLLFFTGLSRIASEVASKIISSMPSNIESLRKISQMVSPAISILQNPSHPLTDFGGLLHEAWTLKRTLTPEVTNPKIDSYYRTAMEAGATGGKLLGAGGGGFLLLFVPPKAQESVCKALASLIRVPFEFEDSGSRVVLYQPDGL